MAETKIRIGKELAKGKVDASKIGKGRRPSAAEVEGQSHTLAICPYCWTINDFDADRSQWVGYICWSCGAWFEV